MKTRISFLGSAVLLFLLMFLPELDRIALAARSLAALAEVRDASGSGSFTNTGQALSADANDLALGDLDGDDDLDLFIVTGPASRVWINQGGPQGGAPGVFEDSGQNLGQNLGLAVALGDLDGDLDLDAFVIEDDATGNTVWLNQGGAQGGTLGVFASSGQAFGDDLSSSAALADVDGDTDLDAYIARSIGRADKVWLNDGSGQFADSGQDLGDGSSTDAGLADLDGDGDPDAFVSDADFNTVWINQGGAQGGTPGDFLDSGQSLADALSVAVALGDIDRDEDIDAVTASVNSGNHVWVNQGGAQGGTPGEFAAGGILGPNNNRHVTLSDVDVDGDPDLFVSRNGPNTVWINQGGVQGGTAGQFLDSGQLLGSLFSTASSLGDIDGDNDPDAAVANFGAAGQVWRNEGLSGLQTFYLVRDLVMAPSTAGQDYIDLFYSYSPEILDLLLADAALWDEGYDTAVLWIPNLASLVDGSGGTAEITSPQVDAVDDFLVNLSDAASPELQDAIADTRAGLPEPAEFVGMTMTQARAAVLGTAGVYLPVVVRSAGANLPEADTLAPAPFTWPQPAATSGGKCVIYCILTGDCN